MSRKSKKNGTWLKRIVIALIAAVAGLLFTKRTVLAPSQAKSEYKLPPVPDVPQPGPEEATPLTEEEQRRLARERSEAAGESGDVAGAIEEAAEAEGAGEGDQVPPPISYEIAAKAAEEARAARESGTDEGRELAEQIEQRMYFAPSQAEPSQAEPSQAEQPQGVAYEPAGHAADEADAARATATDDGRAQAGAIDQRMYAGAAPAGQAPVEPVSEVESITTEQEERADSAEEAASTTAMTGMHAQGDTAPDVTSEGYDVSDGADHTGMKPAEREEPTDVGLDIDVDLEDDEEAAPDITSEGMDTGDRAGMRAGEEPAGVLTSGEGYVRLSGDQRECPEEYPIKGNASSRIYHKPGESSYDATIPEICFASGEIAESMGFRPRKR